MSILRDLASLVASRHRYKLAAALALMGLSVTAALKADVIGFDDFEGLTLVPFTEASGAGDGTDWTDLIRSGTNREWTIDNSLMTGTTTELAYLGFTAMDVDSWIDEQGGQGRTSLGAGTNNTALVADPDAWDDFTTGADENSYNSFASREYDMTGFDVSTLSITLDYEFVTEDNQMGNVEVSFDNGTTWQTLLMFDSTAVPNGTIFVGPGTFNAGSEFSADSEVMLLRVGCFDSGNDWWFAVDNISVTTGDGFDDFEDFEGLTLVPFTEASVIGDMTDFTQTIPNWTIDNSENLGYSAEQAYDGWSAMDVFSWGDEQGGQGRTLFNIVDPNNTVLVGDGDAFYDYDFNFDDEPGAPAEGLNTYIGRTYDLNAHDNCTLKIEFEYEFRVENQQLGVAEVSFDGGATWTRLLELDSNDGANNDVLAGLASFQAGTDFDAKQSNTMTLRFGYLMADNNWWFAVDNVNVEADPIGFVKGDANGNGVANNLDLQPFVLAILNRTQYEATYGLNPDVVLDFDCSGTFNNLDIAWFINVIAGN